MLRKKNIPTLDISQADATLQNIFEACNMEPNTIPFDKIVLRTKINTVFYKICMIIAGIILLFHMAIPLVFGVIHKNVNTSQSISRIEIIDDYTKDSSIYLTFSVPLNAENSYLISPSGDKVSFISYDNLKREIVFPYYEEEVNIYVESESGLTATIIITPDK